MSVNIQDKGFSMKKNLSDFECAMQCTMHEPTLASGIGSCTLCTVHVWHLLSHQWLQVPHFQAAASKFLGLLDK
jgi:hypothetical protein